MAGNERVYMLFPHLSSEEWLFMVDWEQNDIVQLKRGILVQLAENFLEKNHWKQLTDKFYKKKHKDNLKFFLSSLEV